MDNSPVLLWLSGRWNPFLIFPFYMAMGGCIGVLQLIRRTIPTVGTVIIMAVVVVVLIRS